MKRIFLWAAIAVAPGVAGASPSDVPPPPVAPFAAAPVAGRDLASITGKADTAMTIRAENTSTVSHNSVNGFSQTGTIAFDERSFANLTGLSVLSANTGNNVAINSSLNLNVSIQP